VTLSRFCTPTFLIEEILHRCKRSPIVATGADFSCPNTDGGKEEGGLAGDDSEAALLNPGNLFDRLHDGCAGGGGGTRGESLAVLWTTSVPTSESSDFVPSSPASRVAASALPSESFGDPPATVPGMCGGTWSPVVALPVSTSKDMLRRGGAGAAGGSTATIQNGW